MKIAILGAAGFIGTNLTRRLLHTGRDELILVDEKREYFKPLVGFDSDSIVIKECHFDGNTNFEDILEGVDYVYHLISTNNPTSSNVNIGHEITDNICISINILEACVKQKVKKIIFISSGGTVYGNTRDLPISEESNTNPITTYGIQKLTIEKLLYLYNHVHGLDYVIARLANPYGPYQRPNGKLGVVTTFVYKALTNQALTVYGDGEVIRDYIYIEDAIEGIITIANSETQEKIFNLGSGKGTSINEIIVAIENVLGVTLQKQYIDRRLVDVQVNYLDVSKFERVFGKRKLVTLEEGIRKTIKFFKDEEGI